MKFFTRLMVIAALLTMAVNVRANDYLEVQRHYQVYSNGRNSIHFKIPVWAYGRIQRTVCGAVYVRGRSCVWRQPSGQ